MLALFVAIGGSNAQAAEADDSLELFTTHLDGHVVELMDSYEIPGMASDVSSLDSVGQANWRAAAGNDSVTMPSALVGTAGEGGAGTAVTVLPASSIPRSLRRPKELSQDPQSVLSCSPAFLDKCCP